jgi:alcohol dehydrogenase (cytochrome c)
MRLSPAVRLSLVLATPAAARRADEWALHGHDLGRQRYSPLTAIDTGTVRRLVPKWTYHSGVRATCQATPIVVAGTAIW